MHVVLSKHLIERLIEDFELYIILINFNVDKVRLPPAVKLTPNISEYLNSMDNICP